VTRRRRAAYFIAGTIAVAAVSYAARGVWGPLVGRRLDVGGPPHRADYALVLAGDPQSRPIAAAYLYRYGYVAEILLTRPPRTTDDATTVEDGTERSRRLLERLGVKPTDIRVLEGPVRTTMDEAQVVAPLLRNEPQAKLVVVTSDYHTRRGLWSLRRAAPEAAERITAFSAPVENVRPDEWWQSQIGIAAYLGEYLRLAFYHLRYGDALLYAAILLTALGLARRYVRRRRTLRR